VKYLTPSNGNYMHVTLSM